MRFQQLGELLEYVVTCRIEMAKLYKRLQTEADSSRVKMVLEYFQQHENKLAEKLHDYVETAPKRVLESWYKDITFEDFKKRCQETRLIANMSQDDVLELHLDLDNRLIDLLESIAKHTSAGDIEVVLSEFVRVKKTQQQRLVHSCTRMDDL